MMLYEKRRLAEAAAAIRQWLHQSPENVIARHMLAAFTGQEVPARAADEYVRSSFDHFARTFDVKLQRLEYRAPELVMAAVAEALGEPASEREVLDAGCGTGWCGPLLAALCPAIDRRGSVAGHDREGAGPASLR